MIEPAHQTLLTGLHWVHETARRLMLGTLDERMRRLARHLASVQVQDVVPQSDDHGCEGSDWYEVRMFFHEGDGYAVSVGRSDSDDCLLSADFLPEVLVVLEDGTCSNISDPLGQPSPPLEDEDEDEAVPESNLLYVDVYYVTLVYGGPEEGGWYYSQSTRVPDSDPLIQELAEATPVPLIPRIFSRRPGTARDAYQWAALIQQRLDETVNAGRPALSSVLSRGRYQAQVFVGRHDLVPATRPNYE